MNILKKNVFSTANKNRLNMTPAEKWVDGITMGWNLSNSFEAESGLFRGDLYDTLGELTYFEEQWGEVITTEAHLDMVKAQGFNAIRVPVTWSQHLSQDSTLTISPTWLTRVKEIVDWIIARDMKVIINTHHDHSHYWDGHSILGRSDWLYADPSGADEVLPRFDLVWTQIANAFKDYSNDYLVFEGYNELMTRARTWAAPTEAEYGGLNAVAQQFVDSVRATGGNNSTRILCCTSYMSGTESYEFFEMPTDPAGYGYMITQLHPYNSYTNQEIEEKLMSTIDGFCEHVNVPVILGEFGTSTTTNAIVREEHALNFSSRLTAHGLKAFIWDGGHTWFLLDREAMEWRFDKIADNLILGLEHYPIIEDIKEILYLDDISDFTYGRLDKDGVWYDDSGIVTNNIIPVTENYKYIIEVTTPDNGDRTALYAWYDENDVFMFATSSGSTSYKTITAPIGAHGMKTYIYNPWNTWSVSTFTSRLSSGLMALTIKEIPKAASAETFVDITSFDFGDKTNYTVGEYDVLSMSLKENRLTKATAVPMIVVDAETSYKLSISNTNIGIVVKEFDAHFNVSGYHKYLINGMYLLTEDDTRYIKVTLYDLTENIIDFEDFEVELDSLTTFTLEEGTNPDVVGGVIDFTTADLSVPTNLQTGYFESGVYKNEWYRFYNMCTQNKYSVLSGRLYELDVEPGIELAVNAQDADGNHLSRITSAGQNGSLIKIPNTGVTISYAVNFVTDEKDKVQEDFMNLFKTGITLSAVLSDYKSLELVKYQGTTGLYINSSGVPYDVGNSNYVLFDPIDVTTLTSKDIQITTNLGSVFMAQYDVNEDIVGGVSWDTEYTLDDTTTEIRFGTTWGDQYLVMKLMYKADNELIYTDPSDAEIVLTGTPMILSYSDGYSSLQLDQTTGEKEAADGNHVLFGPIDITGLTTKRVSFNASTGAVVVHQYDANGDHLGYIWTSNDTEYDLGDATETIRFYDTWMNSSSTLTLTYDIVEPTPLMDIPVLDTFTDTDGTQLNAHTADSGHDWLGSGWTISGNRLHGNTREINYVDIEEANVTMSAEFEYVSGGYMALAGRVTDIGNHIRARISSNGLGLYSFLGGLSSYTVLGTYSMAPVIGQSYKLELEMNGSDIKVYLDDVEVVSATTSEHINSTKHGIYSDSANKAYVDNFNMSKV